ncbi:hypothetical protein RJ639_003243 [Escallonia herrerae]|uniref:Retrotransposon gag domain-containing protein n=1 Tax=Escallonia herrerae TaxID=1293975 RepID=A0AA89B1U2_9ASTE|nr:hypothetical protein RJ639_003243 [Escallonia herrerae]
MNKLKSKKGEESKSGDVGDADEALKQEDTNEHRDASPFGGYKNKESKFISAASLSVQQLLYMIASTIRAQYRGPSRETLMYSKPYTKRIDNMRMPVGRGPPYEAVVHSLKGNAFDWYTDLERESIDCWEEEMEQAFENHFYNTRRSVSMMELTNTKQRREEPAVDYINRFSSIELGL